VTRRKSEINRVFVNMSNYPLDVYLYRIPIDDQGIAYSGSFLAEALGHVRNTYVSIRVLRSTAGVVFVHCATQDNSCSRQHHSRFRSFTWSIRATLTMPQAWAGSHPSTHLGGPSAGRCHRSRSRAVRDRSSSAPAAKAGSWPGRTSRARPPSCRAPRP